MENTYWHLYLSYLDRCVRFNYEHDIDPHHYQMEWNHTLPRCVFGDHSIGQYLLFRQHAIASALQTLAFEKNCMCGWHKDHIPESLLEVVWPYFLERNRQNGTKVMMGLHQDKDELGRSLLGVKNAEKLNADKNGEGKSVNAVKGAEKLNAIIHAERDEFGRSVHALRSLSKTYQDLDEEGVSVKRRRNGRRLHAEKDENGKSLVAMKVNSQVWESTVDGHRSNAGGVASHNIANGWDPNKRVRVQ